MNNVASVYLGWGNPRQCLRIIKPEIVILIDGEKGTVLQGERAKAFNAEIRVLTHHMTGVALSQAAAELEAQFPDDMHKTKVFNSIFDRYFEKEAA